MLVDPPYRVPPMCVPEVSLDATTAPAKARQRAQEAEHELCLVTVPYSHLHTPSLAVGLLTAGARRAGLRTVSQDIRFRFAERIGLRRYAQMCSSPATLLLGELTFAAAAFAGYEPDYMSSLAGIIGGDSTSADLRAVFGSDDVLLLLEEVRQEATAFIRDEAERILALGPRIVGCSSSCEQHCASLALLHRIKETAPNVVTLMGGANCEGRMGEATSRAFEWIDYVISGEADLLLAPLCRLILQYQGHIPAEKVPAGVFCRQRLPEGWTCQESADAPLAPSLDGLPYPDYSGYFKALGEYQDADKVFPALQLESSRGCWWRRKGGCTFCGQNGQRSTFRHKAPDRLRDEMQTLQDKYLGRFRATVMADTIFPRSYFSTLLPDLRSEHTIFWMTDANIGERQMSLLASANVRVVLPGIESLHDDALKLLNKPNSAAGNVAFLKFAMENGILVQWHFLYGIPGEKAEWYGEIAEWLPFVSHLQPPPAMSLVRYDRFSAYHRNQGEYGLNLVPSRIYRLVYPISDRDLADLAYFFEDQEDHRYIVCRSPGVRAMRDAMRTWQLQYEKYDDRNQRAVLSFHKAGDQIRIIDTRPCAVERSTTLGGVKRAIHQACRSPRAESDLVRALGEQGDTVWSPAEIEAAVRELTERRLLLDLHGKLLALALKEPIRPLVTKREFLWGHNIDGRLV